MPSLLQHERNPLAWVLLAIMGTGLVLSLARGDLGSGASPTVASLTDTTGVHVCRPAHFDHVHVRCLFYDAEISDLSQGYLQYYGPGGKRFRSYLTIRLVQQYGNSWRDEAQVRDYSVSPSYNTMAHTLDAFFIRAHLTPTHGAHYRVEVADAQGVLGAITFTYTGQ